jgi:hypothetical protein
MTVCTKKLIRIDWLEESPNVSAGCSGTIFSVPCGFAAQAEVAASGRERGVATSIVYFCAVRCATAPGLTNDDRWFFVQMYRWFHLILQVLTIIRPKTIVCWRRAGLRCYWRVDGCGAIQSLQLINRSDQYI